MDNGQKVISLDEMLLLIGRLYFENSRLARRVAELEKAQPPPKEPPAE